MIPIAEALQIIEQQTGKLSCETIDSADAVGRVLAEPIFADSDLPPFNRSQMDGFAVRAEDVKNVPARLNIVGESVAGKGFDGRIGRGEAVRIMTGARLPQGADAVQKKELARESSDGAAVEILETVKLRQHFVARAEEIESGAKIFSCGEIISEKMIAVLAAFGYAKVRAAQKPAVSILATGNEIVPINRTPKRDQIRNSNSLMLKVLARQAGAEVELLPSVKDDAANLKSQIAQAAETD